jgi:hypothetical protein
VTKTGEIVFGSRTQQLTSNVGEDTNVAKNFKNVIEFVRNKVKGKKLSKYNNYIFYGEACFRHTMNYDWDKMPLFLGFDIYDTLTGKFLFPEESKKIFNLLGLDFVPELGTKQNMQPELINDDLVPISKYSLSSAPDRKAEGITIKNYDKQIFSKYVRDVFKEKNAETFGGSPKYNKVDDTHNADFVFKYCTNQRIEKIIMKKIDDGKQLDMSLMGEVIRDTYLDIIEEEWREILTSN